MDRQVIIHCGVQKTASTAFHHFVQKNRDALSAHLEIHTPEKGSLMRDLGRTAALFSLGEASEEKLADLAARMRDLLVGGDTPVLLSHENLPGAMLGRAGVTTLYPRIDDIQQILTRQFDPLKPVFVFHTRQMSAWKTSVYNQAVRSDGYAKSFSEFEDETRACGSWGDLQDRVAQTVGADRVRFFAIEDETDISRPGLQLLRFCGVPDAVLTGLDPVQGSRNESLAGGALEFVRRVNGLNLPKPERRKIVKLTETSANLFRESEAWV